MKSASVNWACIDSEVLLDFRIKAFNILNIEKIPEIFDLSAESVNVFLLNARWVIAIHIHTYLEANARFQKLQGNIEEVRWGKR